ncbi:hypothetical protein [Bradyrhizobium sp. 21]|nr:hypothetical protein [Bradyrhizobium sp. 21]MCK1389026.1 hypothetical protein [Bradyrhizobium sp. 21]
MIDVTELAQYVDRRLPDLTFEAFKLRQVPQMSILELKFPAGIQDRAATC